MTSTSSRRIALAVAAATVFSACQASAAEGLTLHCAIAAKPSYGKPFKYEEIYFIDPAAGKFCTADCEIIFNIESANDVTIGLHRASADIEPDMIIPNWEDRVTIDRKSGALTGTSRSAGSAVSRSTLTGRCTIFRSLPVPVARALQSAPKADRVTFTTPTPK